MPAPSRGSCGWSGRVVLNEGNYDSLITPGTGAVVHPSLYPPLPGTSELYPTLFVVRVAAGADRRQAIARLRKDFGGTVTGPAPTPMSATSGVLATCRASSPWWSRCWLWGLWRMPWPARSAGRRDLAILKTMGFVRGQVSATVAWQATTFAVVAILVGLPLGVAAGRWTWRLTAEQLGVASPPVTPPLLILAIATGAVVAANLIAAPSGWVAAASGRPLCCIRSSRSPPYRCRHA